MPRATRTKKKSILIHPQHSIPAKSSLPQSIRWVIDTCMEREQQGSNGTLCNECANEILRLIDLEELKTPTIQAEPSFLDKQPRSDILRGSGT